MTFRLIEIFSLFRTFFKKYFLGILLPSGAARGPQRHVPIGDHVLQWGPGRGEGLDVGPPTVYGA